MFFFLFLTYFEILLFRSKVDPANLLFPEDSGNGTLAPKPCHLYMYHKGIFFECKDDQMDPRIIEQKRQMDHLHSLAGE